MRKLYRGEVITLKQSDGKGGLKWRLGIVYKDSKKDDSVVTVYCTTQNDGNDDLNILVFADSEEGEDMGLEEDTYIRPTVIKIIPLEYQGRPIGKCSLMAQISKINEDNLAK